jgi:hypothetical protein
MTRTVPSVDGVRYEGIAGLDAGTGGDSSVVAGTTSA